MADRLPTEVVSHIMSFLSLADRKEASLVCRIWYEASLDPILQRNVVLHFHSTTTSNQISGLARRKMSHLVLDQFDNSLSAKSVMLNSCEHLSQSLQSLSLKSGNITEGTFVELLSHCKSLVSLDLSCCNSLFMSGNLLELNSDLQKLKSALTNVRTLNLSSIRYLSDATFNRIVTVCSNVESLALASTQITFNDGPYVPKGKTRCVSSSLLTFYNILAYVKEQSTHLKGLNLSRTTISDEPLEDLVTVKGLQLKDFSLAFCRELSDDGIVQVCKHQKNLQSFDIRGCCEMTDSCVFLISTNLVHLENLQMGKCRRFTNAAVKTLKRLPSLQVVDVSENYQLSSNGLIEGLCGNINIPLTHLNLNCCPAVTDSFVVSLCKVVPHLQHLDLGSCFPITDMSVIAISKSMKYLRYLRLAWCKEITDLGLLGYESSETSSAKHVHDHEENGNCRCTRKYNSARIFKKPVGSKDNVSSGDINVLLKGSDSAYRLKNLSLLRELDLSNCPKLTDTGLTEVLQFKELKSLTLDMLQISDTTVFSVSARNPSLEHLGLAQCSDITDDAIESVVRRLSRLTSLNISSCDKLTNNSIHKIKSHGRRLRNLDVSFCQNISVKAVEALENSLNLQNVQKRLLGGV